MATNTTKKTEVKTTQEETKIVKKTKEFSIKEDNLVKVKSNFFGKLYYHNAQTGESVIWDRQGEIQIMSIRELRLMKNQQVAFFKNQWISIVGFADGEENSATLNDIYKNLIITQYYTNYIDPDNFDEFCTIDINKIEERLSMLSASTKDNLAVALRDFIKEGRLDSVKRIKVFEKLLDCKLSDFE